MKGRTIVSIVLLLTCFAVSAQEKLHTSLTDYLASISIQPVDSIIAKCDILIGQGGNEKQKADIAGVIFDYFSSSPIMGIEKVAVYVADNYFLNKKLPWGNENTFPLLYTYAEFNRASLVGNRAPAMTLENFYGDSISIRDIRASNKILYFYDDECAQCARQTPRLVSLLNEYSGEGDIILFAVYTKDVKESWEKYISLNFNLINNPKVTVFNLWDPLSESSFHKKYGVLTTPAMLLVDGDNVIQGRKLDVKALAALLEMDDSFTRSLYALLDDICSKAGDDIETLTSVADAFFAKTANDENLFRQTFYAIYNYFKGSSAASGAEAAAYVAQKYFVGMADKWSNETIADITLALKLYGMNPLGAMAKDVVLYTPCGGKQHLIRGNSKYTVLFFNIANCSECANYEQQLFKLTPLATQKGCKIVSIYLGADTQEWKAKRKAAPKEWKHLGDMKRKSSLYDDYDLMYVPKIYLLDSRKTIIAKDINPSTLESLLEAL